MNSIIKIAPDLNRVYLYHYLNECEIDAISYHSITKDLDFHHLMKTKCSTTVKLVCYLLNMIYLNKRTFLTSYCVVEIAASNINLPSHTLVFYQNRIYHSYAMYYSLKEIKISKETLKKKLKEFETKPSKKLWKDMTGVDDFQKGKYNISFYEYQVILENHSFINSSSVIYKRALSLIENSLNSLKEEKDERYLYDDFLCVFGNPSKEKAEYFLKDLKQRLKMNYYS